ncbi:hypothetical protein LF1_15520 [Rubripirellula obstinata]|uniref:Uncharacterized protein n=1 Tax=Rubripirellula obstinata TaxID=406547 RepID=A0A5B1CD24_9BACT|nr:hypothetical protein LF1_15520 [Rubripirellula obstinata]
MTKRFAIGANSTDSKHFDGLRPTLRMLRWIAVRLIATGTDVKVKLANFQVVTVVVFWATIQGSVASFLVDHHQTQD